MGAAQSSHHPDTHCIGLVAVHQHAALCSHQATDLTVMVPADESSTDKDHHVIVRLQLVDGITKLHVFRLRDDDSDNVLSIPYYDAVRAAVQQHRQCSHAPHAHAHAHAHATLYVRLKCPLRRSVLRCILSFRVVVTSGLDLCLELKRTGTDGNCRRLVRWRVAHSGRGGYVEDLPNPPRMCVCVCVCVCVCGPRRPNPNERTVFVYNTRLV